VFDEPLEEAAPPDGYEIPESAVIYPLIADRGNQRVLREWVRDHDNYRAVEEDTSLAEAEFDVCIIDAGALEEHHQELRRRKSETAPVLLPVLLLLAEPRTGVIDVDRGSIADNVFATTIDEIVSLPIRQAELEWRLKALLRLRVQSRNLQRRTDKLSLFRQAVEDSGHAVYITDTDGEIRYVNPAFEDITGYSRSEAIGQTPRLLNSGQTPESHFEELWDTLEAGEVWRAEVTNRQKSGETYHAFQTIAPVTRNGEVSGYVAVQRDITARKEREAALERRTTAIEEAPIGVSISDPAQADNPLIYVNNAYERLTGYSAEEATGRNCRYLQGDDTDPECVAELRRAIDAEEPVAVDIRNYRKDGVEFWNHLTVAPVEDDDGELVNYVGFQQDVTDRKQREQQLSVLGRILRHNLRNEMNVIQGQAETIRAQSADDVAERATQIVEHSEDLLAMADKERIVTEALTHPKRKIRVDLCDMMSRVAERATEGDPSVTVRVNCPDEVIRSVSKGFDDAIYELVTNAVEHNTSADPEVAIEVATDDDGVTLEVRDNGPTLPEMERALLVAESEQTPTYHGSGLGLWLVRVLVTRSDGMITHRRREPSGNVVRIELPGTGRST
jgi:PAS domain S-box-containing protein